MLQEEKDLHLFWILHHFANIDYSKLQMLRREKTERFF